VRHSYSGLQIHKLIVPSLSYRKWSDCPPRSPLGRADALYGTHDHLLLLLARIADFTVRDRARKLRQVEADGGWRPKPGMPGFGSMGPPPGRQASKPTTPMGPPPAGWKGPPLSGSGHGQDGPPMEGHGQTQGRPPPSAMPDFFGMAPTGPTASLSSSYANPNYQRSPPTPNTPHPRHNDLSTAYQNALAEWEMISAAQATISHILTNMEAFAPLPPDIYPPVPGGMGNMTPFGPALIHRSYDISIIWTLLHLVKIILLRSHPAMPPAAQMAAGVCAPATQPYAMLIGRITAGMQIPMGEDLSPSLGAVLTESTLSLFFAGVQYQDPRQREWVITRLLDIDRRTGWASAGIIARGCETAWQKAADMGRGPPYQRRTRKAGEEGPIELDSRSNTWSDRADASFRPEGVVSSVGGRVTERGFVVKSQPPPWAMNLLGTEEDLRVGMERVGL
jgi:hypothetical protein